MRNIKGLHTSGLKAAAARFIRSSDGNFAILFGVAAPALAVSVGFAVDLAQIFNVKSSLQGVVDAAVTSTARDLTLGDATPDQAAKAIKIFIDANSSAGVIGSTPIVIDNVVVDRVAMTVRADAHVDAPLFFPLFGTDPNRRVAASTTALYSDKTIEVAMMLDVTGSMAKSGKKDKIGDLKKAATNAVNLLLDGQNAKKPRVRIAIVPYAEGVNAGPLADSVFVEEKGGSNLPPLFDDLASLLSPILSVSFSAPRPDNCSTERKTQDGAADYTDNAPDAVRTVKKDGKTKYYNARINRDDRITEVKDRSGRVVGTKCPKAEIVPLTANKQKLLDTIEDFAADGVTAGGIAAQWGYYMLSPKWRQTIKNDGQGDGPVDFNAKKVQKVAILMTDGQFNTAFAGVPDIETPQNSQGTRSRANAEAICDNMKKDGIAVYTIGFDLPSGEASEARGVLKDCASPDKGSRRHFFDVSTGAELDAAFKEIIQNTETLALTK